jgi:hypothetical protein
MNKPQFVKAFKGNHVSLLLGIGGAGIPVMLSSVEKKSTQKLETDGVYSQQVAMVVLSQQRSSE